MRVLTRRWPSIASVIEGTAECSAQWVNDGPSGTLLIDGIHLSSSFDRTAEAATQATLVPEDSPQAWVYGAGCGELPSMLLKRPSLQRLHVIIMNPAVFRAALGHFDHLDWLDDPRVELELGGPDARVAFPFCAVPSSLQLACNAAARLRDQVQLELDTSLINRRIDEARESAGHVKANLATMTSDGDVNELFGRHAGGALSVVGAGPTLDFYYGFLATPQPIIAVDRALGLLVERGISPRYVVAIDPHPMVIDYLDIAPKQAREITLVYAPTIPPEAVERWPGPRFASYGSGTAFDEAARAIPKGRLFHSGSVIHPAVDLAVRMGAHYVLLFGADFSFPFGKHHANGSWRSAHSAGDSGAWVQNWQGERIPTLNNLRGYLRDLEDYIGRHPEVSFYSFGEQGARLTGSRLIRGTR